MSQSYHSSSNAQKAAATAVMRTFGKREKGSTRKGFGAPVRTSFAVSSTGQETSLSKLLGSGGGRGGNVRIKLYLSLLWVAAREPYSTVRPARFWAALIGLDDPEDKGARRIRSALGDLKLANLVSVTKRGGSASEILLLKETGSGEPYTVPGLTGIGSAPIQATRPERYFRVPESFWTYGWVEKLTSPAIAMLLILLAEGAHDGRSSWFSPATSSKRYGISTSTRKTGLNELVRLGLVEVDTAPALAAVVSSIRKPRNVYSLDLEAFTNTTK